MNRELGLILAVPAALWVAAALLLLNHWWSGRGESVSAADSPERLLAAAVARYPTTGTSGARR